MRHTRTSQLAAVHGGLVLLSARRAALIADPRALLVLRELENKVICSDCHEIYLGPDKTQEDEAFRHSLGVTRYNNSWEDDQLSVDLACLKCGHGGAYQFSGNPLKNNIFF